MSGIPTHNEAAQTLAGELGLLGKAVFLGEWVPYEDWPNVLLESDIALTLHPDTLEARLAFRSRVLDYIWAGLPIIATRGDATSDLVERYRLGIVVDYEDDVGVANAILRLLEIPKEAWQAQFESARRDLTWERVAQPLIEFCRHPRRAPDQASDRNRSFDLYYLDEIIRLTNEVTRLRALVEGYKRGWFIRLIRWLRRMRKGLK
jgi:glycosyltransferase involved in cell wall biosynthesis